MAKNVIKMIHTGGINEAMAQMGQSGIKNNQSRVANTNRSLINSLFQPELEQRTRDQEPIPENLQMLKTLARSYFEPEAMNTNAFDIRFYEKINAEQRKNEDPACNEQLVELGNSMLLMNAPRPDEIEGKGEDPLRISRFLLRNID